MRELDKLRDLNSILLTKGFNPNARRSYKQYSNLPKTQIPSNISSPKKDHSAIVDHLRDKFIPPSEAWDNILHNGVSPDEIKEYPTWDEFESIIIDDGNDEFGREKAEIEKEKDACRDDSDYDSIKKLNDLARQLDDIYNSCKKAYYAARAKYRTWKKK